MTIFMSSLIARWSQRAKATHIRLTCTFMQWFQMHSKCNLRSIFRYWQCYHCQLDGHSLQKRLSTWSKQYKLAKLTLHLFWTCWHTRYLDEQPSWPYSLPLLSAHCFFSTAFTLHILAHTLASWYWQLGWAGPCCWHFDYIRLHLLCKFWRTHWLYDADGYADPIACPCWQYMTFLAMHLLCTHLHSIDCCVVVHPVSQVNCYRHHLTSQQLQFATVLHDSQYNRPNNQMLQHMTLTYTFCR